MEYKLVGKHRTGLMGIAAVMVFYFHTTPTLFARIPALAALERWAQWQSFIAVDLFFLLSAFGLTHLFRRGDFAWKPYLKKRFLRIWPALFVMTLAYALADGWSLRRVISTATMYRHFFVTLHSILWFLPAILVFYALAPIYYFRVFAPAKDKGRVTAVSMLVSVLASAALYPVIDPDYYTILFRVPVFLLGFLWGDNALRGAAISRRRMALYAASAAVGVALNNAFRLNLLPTVVLMQIGLVNLLIAPMLAVLLTALLEGCDRLFRRVNPVRGAAEFYGRISLEFYCVHEFLYQCCLRARTLPVFSAIPPTLTCFVLSTLAACLLHAFCEALLRRFCRPKKEPPVA